MPPRLIRDAETGWYGWESRFNYILRMSNSVMFNTNKKLEREKHRHVRFVKEMKDERRDYDQKSTDELKRLRAELLEMKAYKAVYRKHSLKNYYKNAKDSANQPKKEQYLEKTKENLKKYIADPETPLIKHEDGEDDNKSDETNVVVTSPNIDNGDVIYNTKVTSPQDSKSEKKRLNTTDNQHVVGTTMADTRGFHSIALRTKLAEEAHKNLVIAKLQMLQKTDPFGLKSILNPEDPSPFPSYTVSPRTSLLSFNQMASASNTGMAAANMTTRAAERKRLEQQQALEVRQRVFPEDCKNRFTLTRFIEKKKSELYQKWSEPERKKQNSDKLIEKNTFPKVVERSKTTSAIFRDYKSYKSIKDKISPKKRELSLPHITVGDSSASETRQNSAQLVTRDSPHEHTPP